MCTECFTPYDKKWHHNLVCKNCGSYGTLVEIDEIFLESIIILNKKGYKTNYCCSGHLIKEGASYIAFPLNIILPFLPNDFIYSKVQDKALYPHIDWDKRELDINQYSIMKIVNTKDITARQKEILKSAINVLDWAIALPVYESI
jgi:hypothetical protein